MQAESAFSFIELVHRLGARAAEELFGRIDKDLRHGEMILGRNVRDARPVLGRLRKGGNVQVIISERSRPKRTRGGTSECLIVLRIDDLEAVVRGDSPRIQLGSRFRPAQRPAGRSLRPDDQARIPWPQNAAGVKRTLPRFLAKGDARLAPPALAVGPLLKFSATCAHSVAHRESPLRAQRRGRGVRRAAATARRWLDTRQPGSTAL